MFEIEQVDHIGIRVIDETRSAAFYEILGFHVRARSHGGEVVVARNPNGVEINFIVNAKDDNGGANILMDVAEKYPGYTHIALRVPSLSGAIAHLEANGIALSGGPVERRESSAIFCRDPDGNVIELLEIKKT